MSITTPDPLIYGDVVVPEIMWLNNDPATVIIDTITDEDADVETDQGGTIITHGGSDTVILSGLADAVVNTGSGDDYVVGDSGGLTVNAGAGDDWVITGTGDATVHAGAGDDIIDVYGNAVVNGGSGDDFLTSYGNGDVLFIGGTGDDVMTGGGGQNTFRFNMDSGNDFVDQVHAGDKLEFSLANGATIQYDDNPDDVIYPTLSIVDAHGNVTSTVQIDLVGTETLVQNGHNFTITGSTT